MTLFGGFLRLLTTLVRIDIAAGIAMAAALLIWVHEAWMRA
jgi:hypothetical protein